VWAPQFQVYQRGWHILGFSGDSQVVEEEEEEVGGGGGTVEDAM